MKTSIKRMKLADLIPTENNPRQIKKDDFERLKKSVQSFPQMLDIREIVVDENNRILGGHQRVKALLANGEKEVNVKVVEGLSEEEKREFVVRDNIQNGEWDFDVLANEWDDLPLDDWGISTPVWDENQTEYQQFVDKFKPKLTTDDCYTPKAVFEAVEKWVRKEYELGNIENIRPFKPEGDYQSESYDGKVVIDNPPFSILSEIVRWYTDKGVRFFLFAPCLTTFGIALDCQTTKVITSVDIVYENGAKVLTNFVTNMASPNVLVKVAGTLRQCIEEAQPKESAELEHYSRPKNLKVGTDFAYVAKLGHDWELTHEDCQIVKNADGLKDVGKGLYGGGLIVSDKVAERLQAERLQAEKPAVVVELSDREKEIVAKLNGNSTGKKAERIE